MKMFMGTKGVAVAAVVLIMVAVSGAATVSLDTTAIDASSYVTFSDDTMSISGSYVGSYSINDWVFFGAGEGYVRVEKASTDYLGTLTGNNSGTPEGSFRQSWTNGTPVASGTNSQYEVYQGTGSSSGGGTSLVLNATMPSTSGNIYLLMSNYYNESDIVVTINGSDTTFADVFGSKTGSVSRLFDLSISDVEEGASVTITFNNYESASSWSNIVPWGAAVAVPEPMTLGLVAAGGVLMAMRRRRRR